MLVIGSVVLRVRDLAAQAAFWCAALHYVVREPPGDDFVLLHSPEGRGPNVSLDVSPSERVVPPRLHLDLYAQDQAAEVERLEALGARLVHWEGRPDDADYLIMEDPEGNRFCVIDAAEWSGWGPDPAGRMDS
ncbi:VOC family protein [Arthrobacter woluwensis]|uniref:VOC family protein n=1 Tax=Arthrobacter woluwensis TaxID=156980 RepID=UPI0011A9261D|nr:VOC family protein [Arthrobacter woluwensis]